MARASGNLSERRERRVENLTPKIRVLVSICPLDPVLFPLGSGWAPSLVAQIEFAEWTPDGHLRHSKFVGLREDKDPQAVTRE
jgi:ATP-dependent DNA ligase